MAKKIFITVGELSGDLNASLLVEAVRRVDPTIEFVGVGGPKMRAAGVRILADSSTWGSIGILEGAAKFFRVWPTWRRMARYFRDEAPDLYVPVDYRFFSIRSARLAKKAGVPVVYYFSPVSWFGTGLKKFLQMKGIIDLALVALPFSLEQYKSAGIPFQYIGHPLVDAAKPTMEKEAAYAFFGLDPTRPVVGLMPGSRTQEVGRLMPPFVKAVEIMRSKSPALQFILFRASDTLDPLINKRIGNAPILTARANVYDFMNVADALILCSGTATHEASLMRKPMVITYKTSALTAWLVRRTVNPPMIGMPNIISGGIVAPELVQEECTPEGIAGKALEILSDEKIRCRMIGALEDVRLKLGKPGVADRAAARVLEKIKSRDQDNY